MLAFGTGWDRRYTGSELHRLSEECFAPLAINDLTQAIQNVYREKTRMPHTENDVLSVASIYNERGTTSVTKLENCKAILVTPNTGFSNIVNKFYEGKLKHQVGYVIDDIELTSVLWLQSWDKKAICQVYFFFKMLMLHAYLLNRY